MDAASTASSVSTPSPNAAAYNVNAFDGRERLTEINRLLTDFIRYQTQVRLEAASCLPIFVAAADNGTRNQIVTRLKEEHRRLEALKRLITGIDKANEDLIHFYEDPPLESAWQNNNANGWQ